MRALYYAVGLFYICIFFCSFSLKAFSEEFKPSYGLVKSPKEVLFLSCKVVEGSKEQTCQVILQEENKVPEPLSKEFSLISEKDEEGEINLYLEGRRLRPLFWGVGLPVTFFAYYTSQLSRGKAWPFFLLAPLDLLAGPALLSAEAGSRIYRTFQNQYLRSAWKTLLGLNHKKSMRLSSKDFKVLKIILKKQL